ncbi:MAG TPA: hypothetical protein VF945_06885 [Polyangia bacterium]
MRAVAITGLALLLFGAAAGCTSNAGFDFIEAHGALADGASISGHNLASVARVPSLLPALGTVLAIGAPFSGPEDLRGFRIEWQEANIAAGASYPSDMNGPVVFYVARSVPDGGAADQQASVVNGGTITFTSLASKITGTLSNLVLSRNGQTLVTVDAGSFQATRP